MSRKRENKSHNLFFAKSTQTLSFIFKPISNLETFYVISRILRKIRLYQYLILRNVDGGGAQALSRDWSKKI